MPRLSMLAVLFLAVALVSAEPASTEPASAEPASAEPASTEPASAEPASAEPASTEPASAEPASTEPASAESASADEAADSKCYELRVYTAPNGKLDELNRRFRKYSRRIFAKYDMDQVGFWTPAENPDNLLYYILSYPDCTARDSSWARFSRDPEWRRIKEITEAGGRLVEKVDQTFLHATDFSPTVGPSAVEYPRAFELRTYHPAPGKLDALLDRFRNHTMRLFAKHGMTNVGYWLPTSGGTLVYLLAFPDLYARDEAFQEFIADPEWQAAYEASRIGGPLVDRIDSVMLIPTDYSPIR